MRGPTRVLVVVEGDSDAGAVRAAAGRLGFDPAAERVEVRSAHGVTNFGRTLARTSAAVAVCGLYDVGEEWHVRRALVAHRGLSPDDSPEARGFHACVEDLEDELIRALGTDAVEAVLDDAGELRSFRRFQAMPQHRAEPADRQLHRFLGTRATRKVRMAPLLVDALEPAAIPRPLRRLVDHALAGDAG